MPASASSGCRSSRRVRIASPASRSTISRIRRSCSGAESPSALRSVTDASSCSCSPETRIMKNSSRLEWKIARNFNRSSSGQDGSSASSSTRRLNASQEISRLKYRAWSSRRSSGAGVPPMKCTSLMGIETRAGRVPSRPEQDVKTDRGYAAEAAAGRESRISPSALFADACGSYDQGRNSRRPRRRSETGAPAAPGSGCAPRRPASYANLTSLRYELHRAASPFAHGFARPFHPPREIGALFFGPRLPSPLLRLAALTGPLGVGRESGQDKTGHQT